MSRWPIRIMVYGAGDAINAAGSLDKQIQAQLSRLGQVATNRYIAASAQLDSFSMPSSRWVLDPQGRQPIEQIDNFNTGDPDVLAAYVQWASSTLPSHRSVLVLSGHGVAWEDELADAMLTATRTMRSSTTVTSVSGALHHARRLFGGGVRKVDTLTRAVLIDGANRDYLSNAELGIVCERIMHLLGDTLDVLVFDACLMSSWEILQELSGTTKTVVASVDELSSAGIDLSQPVYSFSVAKGQIDAATMASSFAFYFMPRTSFDTCVAIDLTRSAWGQALVHFRNFAASLLPWLQASPQNRDTTRVALRTAATSIVKFTSGGLADLGVLAHVVNATPQIPRNMSQSLTAAADALGACVIGRAVGHDYEAALGLSIFAPGSEAVYMTNRAEYLRLQLPNVTGWGIVLDTLFGFR